jgi:predicted ATPase
MTTQKTRKRSMNETTKLSKPGLKRFSIENFKAFRKSTLDLAPLTILIGENSSGKSSILQALLLIKQTLESPSGGGILNLNSHYVQFRQFREIVFGMPTEKAIIGFELEIDTLKFYFQVGSMENRQRVSLLEWRVNDKPLPIKNKTLSASHLSQLFMIFTKVGYIRPIRPAPERYYTLSGLQPDWIGIQAENIADFLESNPEVRKKVQHWFVKTAKLANQVQFKSDLQRGQMEILFTEAMTGLEIDISRLGFGYSQILPIVVATFSYMNMLIFEAPEIHLNPSLHGVLTDLFIEGANSGKQILVETHSEHIIYRLQRRIAEGQIALKDVAIYYVRRGAEGSTAEPLDITETGEIPNWPAGFFDARMSDVFARVLATQSSEKEMD